MRVRLFITLALCWWSRTELACADDYDDDFGALPSDSAPAPAAAPPVAPASAYLPLDDDPALTPSPAADPRRMRRAFMHPTVEGLLGGVHTVDANSGMPGTFRVALNGGFFRANGFTAHDDHHRSTSSTLALNVTPIEHLELAGTLSASSTQNRSMDPDVVQVVGDIHLFAKTFWTLRPWLHVAGDMELALLNGVDGIGVQGNATSVGLRAAATADLRALEHHALPLIVRSNLRYLFDNSGRLASGIEHDRYVSLNSTMARADDYRALLSPAERSALGVNRVDRIGMSFGIEVPLKPHARVPVSPLLEWTFALPVNRQGFDCIQTQIAGQRDHCLANTGFSTRPSMLTLGARVQPWLDGLAALLAIDVATTGSHTFVRELAPLERYVVRLALSYAYDAHPEPPRPRIQRVEIPAPSRSHVVGQVVDAQSGEPVANAVIHFEGVSLSDVLSDQSGAFKSAELAPGAQGMRVRADGYQDALCIATLGAVGVDVAARCELNASTYYGTLSGQVSDTRGKHVAGAHLALSGAGELSLSSKKDGSFHSDKLPVGSYELIANAPGYFERHVAFEVARNLEATPAVVLLARPPVSLVRMTPQAIVTARPIAFTGDTAIIADESQSLLGELAELLNKHPQLTHVDIEGHLDDHLPAAAALALSEQRAQAVRAWLIDAGVDADRLGARGFGSTRPAVPNITKQNRARNRRIELRIK